MFLMTDSTILVAPRELKDQVERASRVLLCEASTADRLAEDITFCEINYGQGIYSWLEVITSDSETFNKISRSSLKLRLPSGRESVVINFDLSLPFAFLARTLHTQEKYGVTWSCDTEVISGNSRIASVNLKFDTSISPITNQKTVDALSTGLRVSLLEWNQLNKIASQFLLSEEILDAS